MGMKISIEPTRGGKFYNSVAISHPSDDLSIDEMTNLLRAALLAWGYQPDTVDSLMGKQ